MKRLFSLGIREETPPRLAQRITAANGSILSNGVGAALAGLILLAAGQRLLGLLILSVPLVLSFGMVLLVLGQPTAARLWCALSQPTLMLVVGWLVGPEPIFAVPFVIVLVPFTVFTTDERGPLIGSLLFAIAAAAALFFPGALPPPVVELTPEVIPVAQAVISLAVFVALVTSLYVAARARDLGLDDLDAARLAAEQAQQTQSSFLARMSHEIRTPLGAILGWVQLLDDPRASAPERVRAVDTLKRNSGHLLELVDQVLDLSKMEAGELLVEAVPTSVVAVIEDVASLMRVRAVAREIGFVVSWDGPLPETIETDPLRLRQVLLNLVGNAVKFTEAGRVEIRAGLHGSSLHISVEDTGIGMEPGSVDQLFGSFIQAEPGTARRFGGTGLGLAIARELIQRLGGQLRVESQPGHGSCFTVVLPVSTSESKRRIDPTGPLLRRDLQAALQERLSGLRVLLAEDSDDLADLVRVQLSYRGAQVEQVGDGKAALDRICADPAAFDAVLMDMQMPLMDGYQATRNLRARGIEVPVVALTAHAMKGDRERCLAAGCTSYLTKPIDFDALAGQLRPYVPAKRSAADPTRSPTKSAELADALAMMRTRFVQGLPKRMAELRAALEAGDLDGVRGAAHQLAGSSGSLGLTGVGQRARELELATGPEGHRADLAELLGRLEAEAAEA
jgi:signal transduction histidine kinase/CheY-like chemotaxis protein